jgi:hypothetical protein
MVPLNQRCGNYFDWEHNTLILNQSRDTLSLTNVADFADKQGLTGSKTEYNQLVISISLKLRYFDLDAELKIWVSSEACQV